MDGNSRCPEASAFRAHVSETLHSLECEAPAHAEMYRIRVLHEHRLAGVVERRTYSRLWLALALRRSVCSRSRPSVQMSAAAVHWQRELDAVQNERARAAVDSASRPGDDAPLQDASSPCRAERPDPVVSCTTQACAAPCPAYAVVQRLSDGELSPLPLC